MFSSFVDGKVISRWADREPLQQLFDNRLEKERLYDTDKDSYNCHYRKCTTLFESGTVRVLIIKGGHAHCCKMRQILFNVFQRAQTQSTHACFCMSAAVLWLITALSHQERLVIISIDFI